MESAVELTAKDSVKKEKATQNGDDFSVDDLLDFSNDDVFVDNDEVQRKKSASLSLNNGDDDTLRRSNDFSSSAGQRFESLPTSELAVPMDDIAELEWLSNFVEDSFTPCSAPTKKPVWLTGNRRHPVPPPVNKDSSSFKTPLPVKIRSKRARTGPTAWSLGSPSLTDSSSSSTTSSSSSSGPSSPQWLSDSKLFDEPVVKRQKKTKRKGKKKKKKKPSWEGCYSGGQTQTQTQTRRCSHCGVQKTPQWRAGPNGAKTLCNACGVRFKSGRLLPEYRPACSPTFSSELHSNHHRKVIEIRRKKETSDGDETGLNPPVEAIF